MDSLESFEVTDAIIREFEDAIRELEAALADMQELDCLQQDLAYSSQSIRPVITSSPPPPSPEPPETGGD